MSENKSQSHKDIYKNQQNSERQTRDEAQESLRRAELKVRQTEERFSLFFLPHEAL